MMISRQHRFSVPSPQTLFNVSILVTTIAILIIAFVWIAKLNRGFYIILMISILVITLSLFVMIHQFRTTYRKIGPEDFTVYSQHICNNPSINIIEKPKFYNQEPSKSVSPLEQRYFELEKYFETTTYPTLQKLDEYLTVSIEYYQKEAEKGEKDHKEAQQAVNRLKKVASGSYQQEKLFFCLASQQAALTFAKRFQNEGKGELAERHRTEATNWQKLVQACQRYRQKNNE